MTRESRSTHKKALRLLSEHPEIISIDPIRVVSVSIEPLLFYRGSFYSQPDLIYELKERGQIRAIIVEYKSNGNQRLIEKGEGQLEKAVDFYQKIKGIPTEGRVITGTSYPEIKKRIHR